MSLNNKKIVRIPIEYILPDKDNMEIAVDSLYKGRYSNDSNPLEVYKVGDKYVLSDGHHRLLELIVNGEASADVYILNPNSPISTDGTVELNLLDGDYYGLDNTLDNGWLIKRLRL